MHKLPFTPGYLDLFAYNVRYRGKRGYAYILLQTSLTQNLLKGVSENA